MQEKPGLHALTLNSQRGRRIPIRKKRKIFWAAARGFSAFFRLPFSQRKEELKTVGSTIDDANFATMERDGVAHDGKSEARASVIAGAAFGNTVETFKKTRKMLLRNSATGVIVAQADHVSRFPPFLRHIIAALDMDSHAVSGIFQTILDEVTEYRVNQRPVAIYHKI